MRISDWSSDVCSSDLAERDQFFGRAEFKQLLPQACTISPGHRDLETEFTAEADPRQTHRYLAQVSLPGIHVWESLGRQIDIQAQLFQHLSRLGAGHHER